VSTYAENDGRFPDESPVLVRYPLKDGAPRDIWPWLPGTILGQCHPGTGEQEWHVVVDGRDDLAVPDLEDPGGLLYPACFRTADEIRHIEEDHRS
jgi:hypothetical protein